MKVHRSPGVSSDVKSDRQPVAGKLTGVLRFSAALAVAALIGSASLVVAAPPASTSSAGGSAVASTGSGGSSTTGGNQTTGPQKDPAKAAIETAVTALTKEYAAFVKDAAANPLRAHADYFSTNPATDITEDAVVAAMLRSPTGNAREDIYIKWQLLSAVPGRFSDKSTQAMIRVFSNHPSFEERPGVTAVSKRQLEQIVRGKNAAMVGEINTEFTARIEQIAKDNAPLLQFLDDLYIKLTPGPETIGAGFAEAVNRAYKGIDSDLMTTVINNTRSWASGGVPAPQLAQVRRDVSILIKLMGGPTKADATPPSRWQTPNLDNNGDDASANIYLTSGDAMPRAATPSGGGAIFLTAAASTNEFPPKVFTGVSYDEKAHSLTWTAALVKFAPKKAIEDLDKYLGDLIANPNAGLKFNEGN